MTKIIISPFCKSRDQHACRLPLEETLPDILTNLPNAQPGYRDGVILVEVPTRGFHGQIRTLQPGDTLQGVFKPRQEGELPRKEIRTTGQADPPAAVFAVLYHRDTLAEGGENSDLTADYEVVTFLTQISKEPQPMPPDTLMANHFLDSGGTNTRMNDTEFVIALKKSYEFWKNKALLEP